MSNLLISTILPSITKRRLKRVGRGHGSGKVKTSGRGTKGQNARGKMPIGFEGGQLPLIKRLPLLRGKGKNSSQGTQIAIVSIASLTRLGKTSEVTLETLKKYSLISDRASTAKLLATGAPDRPYTVRIFCSESARKAIEKAGGSVVPQE